MTSLVNGLGGAAGFGEFSLPGNDDGSTGFIDLTPIFGTQGINFFGRYYTGFYLNNNGSVTFDAASSSFTPSGITGATSNPIIAAYWADIDTRGGAVAPTPGGTSTGSNLLWYDLDIATNTFTATWDDVGYYSGQTNKLNAFQLSIRQINPQGDFDITFRYENVDWTTGGASGGSNGLGGTPARAGYSAGDGADFYELPQSGDQAALLALESASNVGMPGTFVFSVRNGAPTVGITAGDASIGEGDGGALHYLSIPVFLTEASSSTVTVNYTTSDGSALAGQDYVAQSGTVTFAPGTTQQNILVAVTGDAIVEGNETFTVSLSDPSDGASILDGSATGTILDDDFAPAILSIAATSASKAEGQSGSSDFTFTVTRSGDLSGAASAQWAVTGTAVNGADFTGGALPGGTVSFAAGESTKVISIAVAGDTLVESNEAFWVTLSDPGTGTTLGTVSAKGIIRNDDASLSIAPNSAGNAEGDSGSSAFTFTVTRSGDLGRTASAQWAVGGAAVDGADFTDGVLPSGTVSFAVGESSKIISIGVAGDTLVESNEAFSVTLSNPTAGTALGTASAIGTIRNDDTSLSIAATSADKPEGDLGATPFTFTVTRSGDLSGTATVDWAAGGSAVFDADFIPFDALLASAAEISQSVSEIGAFFPQIPSDTGADAGLPAFSLFGGAMPSGTVTFAAGEASKVITVWALGEILAERDEGFVVTLSNASEGVSLDTATAMGTIRDDDGAGTVRSSVSFTLWPEFTRLVLTETANINGTGNALDNQLFGNAGNNVLDGRAGADRMAGGLSNDTYIVDTVGDTVFEAAGEGTDKVRSSVSFSLANGFVENLTLTGGAGIDGTGNALNNQITGNSGNNRLDGGAGNDVLNGKAGNDLLIGGAGKDSFVFDTPLNPSTNVDTILDFNLSDDTIRLENAIFTALTTTGTLSEAAFHIGAVATSPDHHILYDGATGDLFYDANGDAAGGSVRFAHVSAGLALTFHDFLVT
jgi:Ca2+-binding RTX toxin-like protein